MAKKKTETKEGNFWGGEETKAELPKTSATKKREPRKFDWRWLVVGVILIAALVAAVVMNVAHTDNTVSKVTGTIDVDNGDLKINWDRYQTVDVELTESLKISESGTYHLTGALTDGAVIIDAGVGEVRLILDNVTIANSTGPAIACYNAEDLVIELVGENTLSDGTSYSSDYDEDVDGVIYSKADLAFTGEGSLSVKANYQDAIVGKDDVVIRDGTYNITAADDGIRGKDSVYIVAGDLTINSVADGIKSTNEDDFGKGFVMIEGGDLEIKAGAKGVKATHTVIVYGGDLTIDSYDDAVHSDNYIGIVDGEFELTAGDDAMHADRELIIDGGTINVIESYEGLEAQVVTINGGAISVVASDDGINAGGGADSSGGTSARGGMDAFNTDANCVLTINGGDIYINAAGDGVDSNGYVYFNGGNVVVDGPTNNGNGALDSGLGIEIQGGTVIAVGASGMAETLGASSGVCNISVYFSSTQAAGTLIEVRDSAGETVLSHTSAKTFNHMAAGSEALVPGETYTIYLNGTEYQSFTISEVLTTVGNNNVNQHNMPGRR